MTWKRYINKTAGIPPVTLAATLIKEDRYVSLFTNGGKSF
jgi:hypothetical protein